MGFGEGGEEMCAESLYGKVLVTQRELASARFDTVITDHNSVVRAGHSVPWDQPLSPHHSDDEGCEDRCIRSDCKHGRCPNSVHAGHLMCGKHLYEEVGLCTALIAG